MRVHWLKPGSAERIQPSSGSGPRARTLVAIMIHERFAAAATALLLLAACATAVKTDFDRDMNFSSYRTFGWLAAPMRASADEDSSREDPFARNSLLDKRIRAAVEQELGARGFRRASTEEPDFQLHYHVIFKEKLVASGSDFGYLGYQHRRHGTGFRFSVRQYPVGTILIDVIDPGRDQLVWRGWLAGRNRDGHYDEREIRRAVAEILERFPPAGAAPTDDR